ncbi:MAG: response regulator, partial [Paenibacillus sp.]|nr:response regulator [Paenibacillus sp.]
MNKRQKLIVVMLAVFLLWNIAAPLAGSRNQPAARQGVLDLTGWSFSGGSVRLDGQWEWFPDEFVAPGQRGSGSAVRYIDVPGKWDKSFGERRPTAIGAGTYRLQVLLPEHTPSYLAVRVANIRTSHDLYMNGSKVGSSGTPSLVPDEYEARNHAYIAGTGVTGGKLEIVVHAANYSYYAGGGFFQSIWLGDMQSISRMKSLSVGADMTAAIVFFTIGFIAGLVYLLFHRRRELLIFALLNISVMQYMLTHGEKLLYVLWPEFEYEWMTRLQMLATMQIICCIVSLVSILAQGRRERLTGKALLIMYAGFGVVVLLTPAEWFTRIGYLTVAGTSVGYLFIFYVLFRTVWSKHRHAFFIMISTIGVLAAALNQLLVEADIRKPSYDPSFEYIVFMVGLVLLLFDTYMRALADARQLSRSLIRSDQQKSDFLTNTAYELRTPIHTMMNLCHTLLLDLNGDKEFAPRQRKDVETIAAIGRRMSRLLDDMLDLAEANEGKRLFATERISVKPSVSAAVEMMSPLMNDKPIRILNLVEDDVVVNADEGRLIQMLTHLISNAILRLAEGTVTV